MSTQQVTIDRLGGQGDGIGSIDGELVYVPFSLPGETVSIERNGKRARLVSVDKPANERIVPGCQHFGPQGQSCGGCSVQHLETSAYEAWKRRLVTDALASRGIEADVGDLVRCQAGGRRRAVFTVRKTQKGVLFGFNRAASNTIVDVHKCPVLSPGIEAKLHDLRAIASMLATGTTPFRLNVLETLAGLDIAAEQVRLSNKQRRAAIDKAMQLGLARLAVDDEILIEPRKPTLDFSGVPVVPPPGTFVQASQDAQETMTELAAGHLAGFKKSADLFSGCGAFTFRMAPHMAVHAVESDAASLAALDTAARHKSGLKPVSIERRDLFRSPLQVADLKTYGGVVFDPPRAGAEVQSHALAQSKVERIVAVSCNPVTLARDLRILIDGGFRLVGVTPIDQFLWSGHVEAVALLER